MRWMGYGAFMGRQEMCTKFCPENMKEKDHLGDLCTNGGTLFK
jgi:hypothetical protein